MRKLFSVLCAVLLLIPMRVSAAEPLSVTPPILQKIGRGGQENSRYRSLPTIN